MGPLSQALAVATEEGDIDTLRDIAATATALQKGARARGMGIEDENVAAEVVLRAERAIGQALIALKEQGAYGGGKMGQYRAGQPRRAIDMDAFRKDLEAGKVVTLDTLGLTGNGAANYQALAAIPDPEFEARFGAAKATGARLSKVDFYRLVKSKTPKTPTDEQAHGDAYTPVTSAFLKASDALLTSMATVPEDELRDIGYAIRGLANAYNESKAARA